LDKSLYKTCSSIGGFAQIRPFIVSDYLGDFATALQHFDESSWYDLGNFHDESAGLGWDPGLVLACYKSLTLQLLGYAEKARQQAINAFCIATELASPIHSASTAGLLSDFICTGRILMEPCSRLTRRSNSPVNMDLVTGLRSARLSKGGHWLEKDK
jgi:hypothetical protein